MKERERKWERDRVIEGRERGCGRETVKDERERERGSRSQQSPVLWTCQSSVRPSARCALTLSTALIS